MKKTTQETNYTKRGFTIVEIIVVLVILALLIIGSVPFIGRAQADARDDKREADIAMITAAIDKYYQDNGEYPVGQGSTLINSAWSTTADGSWQNLVSQLVPRYIKELPSDPSGETGAAAMSSGLAYDYFSNTAAGISYCGKTTGQMYILLYNYEGREQKNTLIGECSTSPLGPYGNSSNYRVVRDNSGLAMTYCANENQTCSFSGTRTVAYGVPGRYNYIHDVNSSIACNNATFGDPAYGAPKKCYTLGN